MKLKLLVSIFLASTLISFAQVTFEENVITNFTVTPRGVNDIEYADIDNDGDIDILTASSLDNKIVWFENTDGLGNFGPQRIISSNVEYAIIAKAADIDGDGDLDVLCGSRDDNKIVWFENIDGQGNFGTEFLVSNVVLINANDLFSADLDNDGDMDIVGSSYENDELMSFWIENIDGLGNFGPIQTFSNIDHLVKDIADLDGDGDLDILCGSFENSFVWYENTDGLGTFGTTNNIITNIDITEAFSADIDGDGDLDVVAGGNGRLVWQENNDGLGNFGVQQVLSFDMDRLSSIDVKDVNGDGALDVLWAIGAFSDEAFGSIGWFNNMDGQGDFSNPNTVLVAPGGFTDVSAADLNGDGDLDIFGGSFYNTKVVWHENTNGNGQFSEPLPIAKGRADFPNEVISADLNGDGYKDILSVSWNDNKVAWYENLDGHFEFGNQIIISIDATVAMSVYVEDMDGDGDLDVLSASISDKDIAWYENIDGQGTFGEKEIIHDTCNDAFSVHAADIDNDGDMDVLSVSRSNDRIWVYEHIPGANYWPRRYFSGVDGPTDIYTADLDNDGDLDILTASAMDDKIAWLENTDGFQASESATQHIITTQANGANQVYTADLDGDGDLDVVSASFFDDKIAWYENENGQGSFGTQKIISTNADWARSVFAADMDNDGDIDILSASRDDDKIAWYENLDGQGVFGPQQVISTTGNGARYVHADDLDNDGDIDVIAAWGTNDTITWNKNLLNEGLSAPEYETSQILIYPNPTQDNLTIKGSLVIDTVRIIDLNGRLIKSIDNASNELLLDVKNLSNGLYFLEIISGNAKQTNKFIKN